jgi:hypothetical protein
MAQLTDSERKVLTWLAERPAFEFNSWEPELADATGIPDAGMELRRLRALNLVDSRGRGKWCRFWITHKGLLEMKKIEELP